MIKFIMCCTRNPKLSREEFQDYWLNSHGPFFMKHTNVHKAKKYIQSHTLNTPVNQGLQESRGMRPAYDGVAEVWFESVEEFMEAMGTSEGQQLGADLLKDESSFIDHTNSTAFFVEEHEVK